jgi:DNA-directed RNA polymerase specialized sigma subunit
MLNVVAILEDYCYLMNTIKENTVMITELETAKKEIASVGSVSMSETPKSITNKISDSTHNKVMRMVKYDLTIETLKTRNEELLKQKEFLDEKFNKLPLQLRQVISYRYFDNKHISEIQELMKYTKKWVICLLHKAIEMLKSTDY